MIYSIVYDAVRKKASTKPPNQLIANTEMAAAIGIVLREVKPEWEIEKLTEPEEMKRQFMEIMETTGLDHLSEEAKTLCELVGHYKVKKMDSGTMVRSTMEDLKCLAQSV